MKVKLLVCASIFITISSCNKTDNLIREKSSDLEYTSSLEIEKVRGEAFKVLSGHADLSEINGYFSLFSGKGLRAYKVSSGGIDKFSLYLEEHNMTTDDLLESLSEDPSRLQSLIKQTTSQEFYNAFMMVLSSSNEKACIDDIVKNRNLNSVEKGTLVLILLDGKDNQFRSFSSCARRYLRLSIIAVKATAMSFIDVESATHFATSQLRKMRDSNDSAC
mgnify:CR=1 FL=1